MDWSFKTVYLAYSHNDNVNFGSKLSALVRKHINYCNCTRVVRTRNISVASKSTFQLGVKFAEIGQFFHPIWLR